MNHKYNLEFSRKFKKALEKFDKNTRKQINEAILRLSSNYKDCNIVKLSGIFDTYRLRSGNYRILFKRYDNKMLILLLDVKHRKDAYKDLS